MTKPITYSLRCESENSDKYFEVIADYADFVHNFIERNYGWIISQYQSFLFNKTYQEERSRGEYCIEMLMLGMAWHKYSGAALKTPKVTSTLLDFLNCDRISNHKWKRKIRTLRTFIIELFVAPHINEGHKNYNYSLENFLRLVNLMKATGEFKEEVNQLENWSAFLSSLNEWKIDFIISSAVAIFDWFTISSHLTLGYHTENLQGFLKSHPEKYKNREDRIFTGKDETEHHLNMVASEIVNKGFRAEFEKNNSKVLIVPSCMKTDPTNCKANNYRCNSCDDKCNVAQLTSIGSENFFDVKVIPHSNEYAKYFAELKVDSNTSVIVAACILNILPSAFALRNLDIKAQCIPLDYCGCKDHWHPEGIVTDLNKNQILRLVNVSHN